jgi:hypothetical protein
LLVNGHESQRALWFALPHSQLDRAELAARKHAAARRVWDPQVQVFLVIVKCFYYAFTLERIYVASANWRSAWLSVFVQATMSSYAAALHDPGRLSISQESPPKQTKRMLQSNFPMLQAAHISWETGAPAKRHAAAYPCQAMHITTSPRLCQDIERPQTYINLCRTRVVYTFSRYRPERKELPLADSSLTHSHKLFSVPLLQAPISYIRLQITYNPPVNAICNLR